MHLGEGYKDMKDKLKVAPDTHIWICRSRDLKSQTQNSLIRKKWSKTEGSETQNSQIHFLDCTKHCDKHFLCTKQLKSSHRKNPQNQRRVVKRKSNLDFIQTKRTQKQKRETKSEQFYTKSETKPQTSA